MNEERKAMDCCDPKVAFATVGGMDCCSFVRRFPTSKERRDSLESYRDDLRNELAGVEERIRELGQK